MFAWLKKLFASSIVKKNIKMMIGMKNGQMQKSLSDESMGGNTGYSKGRPCATANFWFDENGEIRKFTNDNAPAGCLEGAFKVVMLQLNVNELLKNPFTKRYPEIIKAYYWHYASPKAKETIALSVQLYNQLGEQLVDFRKKK